MFQIKEFQTNLVLEPIIDKLNKFLSKNKIQKARKLIEELENLIDQAEHNIHVTYILSILAEHDISLISQDIIRRIEPFLKSDNIKLKVNSVIILGFFDLANLIKNIIIESFSIEKSKENVLSLLNLLGFCKELNFDELFLFRGISKSLISSYYNTKDSEIYGKLLSLIDGFYPSLKGQILESIELKSLLDLLDKQFLMKKSNFTEISKKNHLNLKEYLKKINKPIFQEYKTLFYTKTKKDIIFVYELESTKLVDFFERGMKISHEKLRDTFSEIIRNDSELRSFIKTLMNLNIIKGYYSDIGFFYSTDHIKSSLIRDLNQKGIVKLKKFNYIPPQILSSIIKDIKVSQKDKLLLGKNKNTYYSLKRIQEQVNTEAAKNSVVDLRTYRERITEEDFINLIKNLPKEYLSNYHKGTQWLTNLGTFRISNEIQSSKIFGFFDILKNSKKLKIGQILLYDVFINIVDDRSGIWDKKNEVFYYSKFLTEKIENLSSISDKEEKGIQIDRLAKELNINKNHIETKLDENLK
ncbi:MAG: hypothetical protein ACXAAH_17965, partial [Promethearchaeota archaeon]